MGFGEGRVVQNQPVVTDTATPTSAMVQASNLSDEGVMEQVRQGKADAVQRYERLRLQQRWVQRSFLRFGTPD